MTPGELFLYGVILMTGTLSAFFAIVRFAPKVLGNQFPEREEREKVLTERVEELERNNKWQKEDLNRQIRDLQLTVRVLSEQADASNVKIAELKLRIASLESELYSLQHKIPVVPPIPAPIVVLGIWPVVAGQPALDQQAEADALYDAGYTYVALRGVRATRSGVIWEVDRVRPTIIQVGGHGDKDGVMLSDGIAEPGWWAELVIGKGVQLVVLLSCDSSQQDEYNMSDALVRAGVRAVVSCDGQIGDADAVKFSQILYGKMAEGLSLAQALQRAKLAVSRRSGEMIRLREGKS